MTEWMKRLGYVTLDQWEICCLCSSRATSNITGGRKLSSGASTLSPVALRIVMGKADAYQFFVVIFIVCVCIVGISMTKHSSLIILECKLVDRINWICVYRKNINQITHRLRTRIRVMWRWLCSSGCIRYIYFRLFIFISSAKYSIRSSVWQVIPIHAWRLVVCLLFDPPILIHRWQTNQHSISFFRSRSPFQLHDLLPSYFLIQNP